MWRFVVVVVCGGCCCCSITVRYALSIPRPHKPVYLHAYHTPLPYIPTMHPYHIPLQHTPAAHATYTPTTHNRYGHTLTRCGPLGNMAVIIGGMTRGGYRGEILDVAVLVQHPPPSTTAPPGGATHTTVPATRSTAARGGRDGSGTHDGSGARDGTVNEDGSEGGHETQEVDEQEGEMRYEWMIPDIGGPAPHARGYHSAAASPDGTKVCAGCGGMGRVGTGCACCWRVVLVQTERVQQHVIGPSMVYTPSLTNHSHAQQCHQHISPLQAHNHTQSKYHRCTYSVALYGAPAATHSPSWMSPHGSGTNLLKRQGSAPPSALGTAAWCGMTSYG